MIASSVFLEITDPLFMITLSHLISRFIESIPIIPFVLTIYLGHQTTLVPIMSFKAVHSLILFQILFIMLIQLIRSLLFLGLFFGVGFERIHIAADVVQIDIAITEYLHIAQDLSEVVVIFVFV